jgi:hypothetical protein
LERVLAEDELKDPAGRDIKRGGCEMPMDQYNALKAKYEESQAGNYCFCPCAAEQQKACDPANGCIPFGKMQYACGRERHDQGGGGMTLPPPRYQNPRPVSAEKPPRQL